MPKVDWNNPHEACAEMRRLDAKYKTDPQSGLHHDNRCPLNHSDEKFIAEHFVIVSVP